MPSACAGRRQHPSPPPLPAYQERIRFVHPLTMGVNQVLCHLSKDEVIVLVDDEARPLRRHPDVTVHLFCIDFDDFYYMERSRAIRVALHTAEWGVQRDKLGKELFALAKKASASDKVDIRSRSTMKLMRASGVLVNRHAPCTSLLLVHTTVTSMFERAGLTAEEDIDYEQLTCDE